MGDWEKNSWTWNLWGIFSLLRHGYSNYPCEKRYMPHHCSSVKKKYWINVIDLCYKIFVSLIKISGLSEFLAEFATSLVIRPVVWADMARNCCWNCKYYIARGDNEPALLGSATSNVCVFSNEDKDSDNPLERVRNWEKRAFPTPPGYVCRHYKERFYW